MSEEPLTVEVDPRSPVPPYEQIRTRLLELVRTGALAPGTRLPPIRQLAGDLGVAPNTVARAYRELEAAGVLSSRRRHGTTVTPEAAERARPGWRAAVPPSGAPAGRRWRPRPAPTWSRPGGSGAPWTRRSRSCAASEGSRTPGCGGRGRRPSGKQGPSGEGPGECAESAPEPVTSVIGPR
ncbi:GntR family transcriptional regulator [Nocardiopsis composta]